MSDERESKTAIDAEFFKITQHLNDIDHDLPPRGSGPRDWTPAPSPDEAYDPDEQVDPADLPPLPPSHPHPVYAQIVLGLAVGLIIATIVLTLELIPAPAWLLGGCGIGAIVCIAAAIFLYLPRYRNMDDDGARV